jgi:hypothetical protein
MTVSESALLRRINRRLAHEGERMCIPRGQHNQLGPYYIVNDRNVITAYGCDLETVARELNVIGCDERLAAA